MYQFFMVRGVGDSVTTFLYPKCHIAFWITGNVCIVNTGNVRNVNISVYLTLAVKGMFIKSDYIWIQVTSDHPYANGGIWNYTYFFI